MMDAFRRDFSKCSNKKNDFCFGEWLCSFGFFGAIYIKNSCTKQTFIFPMYLF